MPAADTLAILNPLDVARLLTPPNRRRLMDRRKVRRLMADKKIAAWCVESSDGRKYWYTTLQAVQDYCHALAATNAPKKKVSTHKQRYERQRIHRLDTAKRNLSLL